MQEIQQDATQLGRILVRATREVAYTSPDHLVSWGTRRDNSRQARFNQKLFRLFEEQHRPLWLLDLGCSGGGFVKDCLDSGCVAVGLEGSDFSKKLRRAEWRTIPEFLFTADITAPFEVVGEFESVTRPVLFDVVTSWEVMEHIHERDLGAVVENVKRHLRPGGLWIMSVAVFDDFQNGINLHQTVKPRQWWIERFAGFGLVNARDYARYFNTQFLRGPKNPRSSTGFQLVLTNDTKLAPPIPAERLPVRIYDRWLGSKVQCILRLALVGVD